MSNISLSEEEGIRRGTLEQKHEGQKKNIWLRRGIYGLDKEKMEYLWVKEEYTVYC